MSKSVKTQPIRGKETSSSGTATALFGGYTPRAERVTLPTPPPGGTGAKAPEAPKK